MAEIKCIPSIQHTKMSDGTFITTFPVTTIDELYYDIDAGITFEAYQNAINHNADITLETEENLLKIGSELYPEISLGKTIYVTSNDTKYIIIDIEKLGSIDAFSIIPNGESGSIEPLSGRVAKFNAQSRLHTSKPISADEVVSFEYLSDNGFIKSVNVEEISEISNINASSLNGIPTSSFIRTSQISNIGNIEDNTVRSVHGANLSNIVPIECLPKNVFQKCVTVKNDDERFNLTTDKVHNGDTVIVDDGSVDTMYFVTDEANLDNESGYVEYVVGTVSEILWKNIIDKPSTFDGYNIDIYKSHEIGGIDEVRLMTKDALMRIESVSGKMDINTRSEIFNDYENNLTTGYYSCAGGENTKALHDKSLVYGEDLESSAENQTVFGRYNDTNNDALFVIGSGGYNKETGELERKNIVEVHDNVTKINTSMNVDGSLFIDTQRNFKDIEDNDVLTKNDLNNLTFDDIHMDINKLTLDEFQYIRKLGLAPLFFKVGDTFSVPYDDGGETDRTSLSFKITGFTNEGKSISIQSEKIRSLPYINRDGFIRVRQGYTWSKGVYKMDWSNFFIPRIRGGNTNLKISDIYKRTKLFDQKILDDHPDWLGAHFNSQIKVILTVHEDIPELHTLRLNEIYGEDPILEVYDKNGNQTSYHPVTLSIWDSSKDDEHINTPTLVGYLSDNTKHPVIINNNHIETIVNGEVTMPMNQSAIYYYICGKTTDMIPTRGPNSYQMSFIPTGHKLPKNQNDSILLVYPLLLDIFEGFIPSTGFKTFEDRFGYEFRNILSGRTISQYATEYSGRSDSSDKITRTVHFTPKLIDSDGTTIDPDLVHHQIVDFCVTATISD